MSALWTAEEAAQATGGKAQGSWNANGISIDTRSIQAGDLFVALRGETRDGHEFAAKALGLGAAAAMVSVVPPNVFADAPLLIVGDTQKALEDLGRAARARSTARIVAVTGSAGKTTTKEMLRLMLSRQGKVSASSASYNNHWGVPLSLSRMARDAAFGVFEIGMNHAGEIRALVSQVRPHVAMVTTIAPAHLEYFGSLEAIADAKGEIFEGVERGGAAIVPADNAQAERLKAHARNAGVTKILTFGSNNGDDARLRAAEPGESGQKVTADFAGARLDFALGAEGLHMAMNALGALLAARELGVEIKEAAGALESFTALGGRGARFKSPRNVEVIDESYNANPASMAAALGVLARAKPAPGGRRIAVLGDMLELGRDSAKLHRSLAAGLAAARTDLVFLCGTQMESLWQAVDENRRGAYAETSSTLAPALLGALHTGDIVLVKGSNGSKMSVIVEALKAQSG